MTDGCLIQGLNIKHWGLFNYILYNVNFKVNTADFILLLGANGAGKTSLLKLIVSARQPTAGQLFFRGQPYASVIHELRQSIGYLCDQDGLYPELTARENLNLYATLYRVDNATERIEQCLSIFKTQPYSNQPIRLLSRGMRQRVGWARMLLHDPDIIILDEPLTGLDQSAIETVSELLDSLYKRNKIVIMVSHQADKALHLFERVWIMDKGRLIYDQPHRNLSATDIHELFKQHTQNVAD